ncbi:hypothetical protein [Persicirhabdus sediminis]|nr:hypothetical protein [Persicirhabdus sediminis]
MILFTSCAALQAGVFGPLEYGDSRKIVDEKLETSPLVVSTIEKTMFGRTGLNGVYKCTSKLAGLDYSLYFDWDEEGLLKEVVLRSEGIPSSEYTGQLKQSLADAVNFIGSMHGPPTYQAEYPPQKIVTEGMNQFSSLWTLENRQSLLCGVGMFEGKYCVSIRFTSDFIAPPKKK